MEIMNVSLIGLGAVGATVAYRLSTVPGINLECIVDKERKERYSKNGVFINKEKVDFNLVTPENAKPADLVIIATKNLQIEAALDLIKNAVTENTMILSLLNGIQSEKDIEKVYGAEKTLYGFIINLVSMNKNCDVTCLKFGKIVFGEKDNKITDRIIAVKELFDRAGQEYNVPENIQLEMWKKFLINVTFNSLGSMCRSPYGGFNSESMKSLARKIGFEVVQVANAEGIPLTNQMLEDDIDLTCSYDAMGKCSMLQDMEAGRRTENDWFCGTIVRLGKSHGIQTPYCQFLWEMVDGTEYARELILSKNDR